MGNDCLQRPLLFHCGPEFLVVFPKLGAHTVKFPAQAAHLILLPVIHRKIQIILLYFPGAFCQYLKRFFYLVTIEAEYRDHTADHGNDKHGPGLHGIADFRYDMVPVQHIILRRPCDLSDVSCLLLIIRYFVPVHIAGPNLLLRLFRHPDDSRRQEKGDDNCKRHIEHDSFSERKISYFFHRYPLPHTVSIYSVPVYSPIFLRILRISSVITLLSPSAS